MAILGGGPLGRSSSESELTAYGSSSSDILLLMGDGRNNLNLNYCSEKSEIKKWKNDEEIKKFRFYGNWLNNKREKRKSFPNNGGQKRQLKHKTNWRRSSGENEDGDSWGGGVKSNQSAGPGQASSGLPRAQPIFWQRQSGGEKRWSVGLGGQQQQNLNEKMLAEDVERAKCCAEGQKGRRTAKCESRWREQPLGWWPSFSLWFGWMIALRRVENIGGPNGSSMAKHEWDWIYGMAGDKACDEQIPNGDRLSGCVVMAVHPAVLLTHLSASRIVWGG